MTATDLAADERPLTLPIGARPARILLLAAVFICAACGLVYELALIALGAYLLGDAVGQASIVLSVFICAMGVGSLAAKRFQHTPVAAFALIECGLATIGGFSVMALYGAFAWLDIYRPAMILTAAVIGGLIGAEIPVLMTLLQRIKRQSAGDAVADLFAVDYVGALVGGLAFPFLLLPVFGQIRGAMLVGAVNAVSAAAVCLWLCRDDLDRKTRTCIAAVFAAVAIALGAGALYADRFEVSARQVLFDDPIVESMQTRYQDIVLTDAAAFPGSRPDVRLFLNGDLQFSSVDEYRYHEALVHPAMSGRRRDVLILGGGDGLAAREVLRYDDVERVVEVELDPQMIELARTNPRLAKLNEHAFDDPRVDLVAADAFAWLRQADERFDVIIVDMPDPDSTATAKLYSVEFYGLAAARLNAGGVIVVQAGSPYFAAAAFWSIEASMQTAKLRTVPYHVDVPSFGNWGFVLAAASTPELTIDGGIVDHLRFLDEQVLAAATVFPRDVLRPEAQPSTLIRPRIVDYERKGWKNY